MLLLGTEVPGT